jgi:outer membrane cobalamin receptor
MIRFAKLMRIPGWVPAMACFLGILYGTPAAIAQQDEERVEEITVTGSRLIRRDLDAPSPVVIVSEAAIKSAGNVTIEETLNELPQLASDNTSSVNSGGGSGILTADLRGLNPERTLVLVNGRRFTPADSRGLTDLSSIPDALVDRVEIVTGGASAVYGSDAIAGAVKLNDVTGDVERIGGVKYTIKDGIIYDARQLLRDVEEMVIAQKRERGITDLPPY